MNRLWIDWCIFATITTPFCKLRLVSNLDNHPKNEFMKPSSTFSSAKFNQHSSEDLENFVVPIKRKQHGGPIYSHSPGGTHATMVIFAPKFEARSKLQSYKILNWCRICSPSAVSIKMCFCFKVSTFFFLRFFCLGPLCQILSRGYIISIPATDFQRPTYQKITSPLEFRMKNSLESKKEKI